MSSYANDAQSSFARRSRRAPTTATSSTTTIIALLLLRRVLDLPSRFAAMLVFSPRPTRAFLIPKEYVCVCGTHSHTSCMQHIYEYMNMHPYQLLLVRASLSMSATMGLSRCAYQSIHVPTKRKLHDRLQVSCIGNTHTHAMQFPRRRLRCMNVFDDVCCGCGYGCG